MNWISLIRSSICKWAATEDPFDGDCDPPTDKAVEMALRFALGGMGEGVVPPERIVPDASGGIVFEFPENEEGLLHVHVWEDGKSEAIVFKNGKVISRTNMDD